MKSIGGSVGGQQQVQQREQDGEARQAACRSGRSLPATRPAALHAAPRSAASCRRVGRRAPGAPAGRAAWQASPAPSGRALCPELGLALGQQVGQLDLVDLVGWHKGEGRAEERERRLHWGSREPCRPALPLWGRRGGAAPSQPPPPWQRPQPRRQQAPARSSRPAAPAATPARLPHPPPWLP